VRQNRKPKEKSRNSRQKNGGRKILQRATRDPLTAETAKYIEGKENIRQKNWRQKNGTGIVAATEERND
jgi:hypothetical protein